MIYRILNLDLVLNPLSLDFLEIRWTCLDTLITTINKIQGTKVEPAVSLVLRLLVTGPQTLVGHKGGPGAIIGSFYNTKWAISVFSFNFCILRKEQ